MVERRNEYEVLALLFLRRICKGLCFLIAVKCTSGKALKVITAHKCNQKKTILNNHLNVFGYTLCIHLLQYNYAFNYQVKIINYMYLL